MLLPGQRQQSLDWFVSQTVRHQRLDPKLFWEWREFYSPGSISFNTNVVTFGETQVIFDIPSHFEQLLQYRAQHLISTEYLVYLVPEPLTLQTVPELQQRTLDQALTKELAGQESEFLYSDNTTRIVKTGDATYILFITDIETMKHTNGLFNYGFRPEKQLLRDRYWLVVTRVEA